MKRKILIILIAGLSVSAGLNAQRVYKDGDKFILDMTALAGMPADAVTGEPKNFVNYSPRTDEYFNGDVSISDKDNKKVFQKLEIAYADVDKNGGIGTTTRMLWVEAVEACQKVTPGSWRLPTQRELMMIWIFKEALETKLNISDFSSHYYWSATEHTSNKAFAWNLYFPDGGVGVAQKAPYFTYYVRCVREIHD